MRNAIVTVMLFAVIGAGIVYAIAKMGGAAGMTTGQLQVVAACILLPIGYIFWKEWRDNYA